MSDRDKTNKLYFTSKELQFEPNHVKIEAVASKIFHLWLVVSWHMILDCMGGSCAPS
jgi:hypothetical protein